MKTSLTTFTSIYSAWLDCFWSMLPGGNFVAPEKESASRQEPTAAHQEWEAEGGCIKPPQAKPGEEPAPKLPA